MAVLSTLLIKGPIQQYKTRPARLGHYSFSNIPSPLRYDDKHGCLTRYKRAALVTNNRLVVTELRLSGMGGCVPKLF